MRNIRPLRENIEKARAHLKSTFPDAIMPAINVICKLITHFVFQASHFNHISLNFQSIVVTLGQYVAGDEKLLHL